MRLAEAFIDANLLVLLVVGRVDRKLVGQHRRARNFLPEDYDRLRALAGNLKRLLVTPNALTEASNLLESEDRRFLDVLRDLIEGSEEVTVASVTAARNAAFSRIGLSDAVLLEAASAARPLVTVDLALYIAVLSARGEKAAFNFTYYRDFR